MNGKLIGFRAGLDVFEKKEKVLPVEYITTHYRLIHGILCALSVSHV
jgi:hypothetical protein